MKKVLTLLLPLIFCSCASQDFSSSQNCSPRALIHLESAPNKLSRTGNSEAVKYGREVMTSAFNEAQKCYELLQEKLTEDSYNLCAIVTTDESGGVSFIDVDDRSRTMDPEFSRCLMESIGNLNFHKLPTTTIFQPIMLRTRKK